MDYQVEILESLYKLKNIHFAKLLPKDISHGECFALMKLKMLMNSNDGGNVTVSMLSNELHVSAPALSRILKHLEKCEYVIRVIDDNDRRNNFLQLTVKGDGIINKVEIQMEALSHRIYGQIGEKRIKEFIQFLNDLYMITTEEIEKAEEL